MAKTVAAARLEMLLAIRQHLGDIGVVVLAGVVETRNRGRADRGSAASALRAVLHAAVGMGAFVNVANRLPGSQHCGNSAALAPG